MCWHRFSDRRGARGGGDAVNESRIIGDARFCYRCDELLGRVCHLVHQSGGQFVRWCEECRVESEFGKRGPERPLHIVDVSKIRRFF